MSANPYRLPAPEADGDGYTYPFAHWAGRIRFLAALASVCARRGVGAETHAGLKDLFHHGLYREAGHREYVYFADHHHLITPGLLDALRQDLATGGGPVALVDTAAPVAAPREAPDQGALRSELRALCEVIAEAAVPDAVAARARQLLARFDNTTRS